MKVSPVTLLLLGAAAGGALFGSCQASRASEAEIRLQLLLTEHAHTDSLAALKQDSLRGVAITLRDSAAVLRLRYDAVRRFVPAAKDSIARLLALLPDTTRAALAPAIAVLRDAGDACQVSLTNCEARAQNAEQRAANDSARIVTLAGDRARLEDAWHIAQRQNAPGFLGLRSFWKARAVTVPLVVLTTVLLLQR